MVTPVSWGASRGQALPLLVASHRCQHSTPMHRAFMATLRKNLQALATATNVEDESPVPRREGQLSSTFKLIQSQQQCHTPRQLPSTLSKPVLILSCLQNRQHQALSTQVQLVLPVLPPRVHQDVRDLRTERPRGPLKETPHGHDETPKLAVNGVNAWPRHPGLPPPPTCVRSPFTWTRMMTYTTRRALPGSGRPIAACSSRVLPGCTQQE
jgi:hypothetical protein